MRNFLNKLFDSFHSNGKLESLENDLLYLRPERYQYWFPDSAKATSPLRPNSGNSKYYISNLYFLKFTRHADTSLKDVNLSYFLLVEGWRMVGTLASALIYFHLSTRIIIITFGFDRCQKCLGFPFSMPQINCCSDERPPKITLIGIRSVQYTSYTHIVYTVYIVIIYIFREILLKRTFRSKFEMEF